MKEDSLLFKRESRLMFVLIVAFFSVFVILQSLFPLASEALTLNGESSTYLYFREATDKSKIVPLYEYLDLNLDNIGDNRISFHSSGWGKADLDDKSYGKRFDVDLSYAYLSFRNDKSNAIVNVGRVLVFEGVAAERLDGLYARTDLKAGFGASAFVGSPVESDLNGNSGDFIYGGRLSYQIPSVLVLGASYLKEKSGSSDFREETGGDIWLSPVKKVVITGRSSYNSITNGWMEHTYILSLGSFGNLRLNGEASWINYKDYFSSVTTDVFKLVVGILDPSEKVRILGGGASYSINEAVVISADYKNYDYDIAGNADYYGGKVAYSVPGKGGAGISYHRMNGSTDKLRYDEYRIYGFKKFGKGDITVDFLDIHYDAQINGMKNTYAASLALGYDISNKVRAVADIDYSRNPSFDTDIRTFVRLVCRFDSVFGRETKGAK